MTGSWKEKVSVDRYISANGHNGSARGWAENCGFKYISASDKDEFEKKYREFVEISDNPILFEIFTSEENDAQAITQMISANRKFSSNDKLKNIVVDIVGEKGLRIIKNIVKK